MLNAVKAPAEVIAECAINLGPWCVCTSKANYFVQRLSSYSGGGVH